jgi:hypothetical protein
MEAVGILYVHLDYFMAIWYFCGHLVYSMVLDTLFPFWYFIPSKLWQPCKWCRSVLKWMRFFPRIFLHYFDTWMKYFPRLSGVNAMMFIFGDFDKLSQKIFAIFLKPKQRLPFVHKLKYFEQCEEDITLKLLPPMYICMYVCMYICMYEKKLEYFRCNINAST